MGRVFRRRIKLAMSNPASRAHVLNIARFNYGTIAHAILVSDFALEHISNDLHIFVRMRRKSYSFLDHVFVNYA